MNGLHHKVLSFRRSAYLTTQLAGWGSYALLYTSVESLKQTGGSTPFFVFALAALLIIVVGIVLSHLMRAIIIYWGLMKLRLRQQAFFLFALSAGFTILFWVLFTVFFYSLIGAGHLLPRIFSAIFRFEITGIRGMVSQCLTFSVPFVVWNLSYALIHYHQRNKIAEWQKLLKEKEMIELEARALRAQMNPHFVFNCLNSIKSLIQDNQQEKAVEYLTTFSKLVRNLFSQSDKNEITLFDEMETCRHYLQLEAMRFDASFSYSIEIDEHIDLKSVSIPALIVQPFIENAIWHGLVPRGTGGELLVKIQMKGRDIEIAIDDNGVGREASRLTKTRSASVHHSKGVNLTQSRLILDNILQKRNASLQYIDKRDNEGKAVGTKVVISIIEEM